MSSKVGFIRYYFELINLLRFYLCLNEQHIYKLQTVSFGIWTFFRSLKLFVSQTWQGFRLCPHGILMPTWFDAVGLKRKCNRHSLSPPPPAFIGVGFPQWHLWFFQHMIALHLVHSSSYWNHIEWSVGNTYLSWMWQIPNRWKLIFSTQLFSYMCFMLCSHET